MLVAFLSVALAALAAAQDQVIVTVTAVITPSETPVQTPEPVIVTVTADPSPPETSIAVQQPVTITVTAAPATSGTPVKTPEPVIVTVTADSSPSETSIAVQKPVTVTVTADSSPSETSIAVQQPVTVTVTADSSPSETSIAVQQPATVTVTVAPSLSESSTSVQQPVTITITPVASPPASSTSVQQPVTITVTAAPSSSETSTSIRKSIATTETSDSSSLQTSTSIQKPTSATITAESSRSDAPTSTQGSATATATATARPGSGNDTVVPKPGMSPGLLAIKQCIWSLPNATVPQNKLHMFNYTMSGRQPMPRCQGSRMDPRSLVLHTCCSNDRFENWKPVNLNIIRSLHVVGSYFTWKKSTDSYPLWPLSQSNCKDCEFTKIRDGRRKNALVPVFRCRCEGSYIHPGTSMPRWGPHNKTIGFPDAKSRREDIEKYNLPWVAKDGDLVLGDVKRFEAEYPDKKNGAKGS